MERIRRRRGAEVSIRRKFGKRDYVMGQDAGRRGAESFSFSERCTLEVECQLSASGCDCQR
jgi:hypothetical protein